MAKLPTEEEYQKISGWLIAYKTELDFKKRNKLKALVVTQMSPVVKRLARTIARRATDPVEDLIQAGFIGLLKAIENYDVQKNDNFRVYAGYLIIGEMKHYLRDKLSTVRVPAYIHELSIRINNFTNSLTPEELCSLTSEDVAAALNVTSSKVDAAMQIERRRSALSLEDMFNGNGENNMSFEELLSKDDYKEKSYYNDAKIFFNDLIKYLPEEEKKLMEMYYYKDMSQREIADELNMTQMSISRRMKKIFSLFCKLLGEKTSEIEV